MHVIDTPGPGGGETVCVRLAAGLTGERWQSVVAVPGAGWLLDEARRVGLPAVIAAPAGRGFDTRYLRTVASRIREVGADVVQTHFLGPAVYGGVAGRVLGVPVVSTFHGLADFAESRFRGLKLRLLGWTARRLVFVSGALRRETLALGGLSPSRAVVIRNGLPEPDGERAAGPDPRGDWGVREGDVVIGAVGNVRPAKAYDVLLHATALLVKAGVPVRVVIAGDKGGPLGEELVRLRDALELSDRVRFLGYREDVDRVLEACDVFVLTSSSEGFSLATVQAMRAGLPVVATRCGGPEEILRDGETGLLVSPGSAEAVRDGLLRVIRDGALARRLGGRARLAAGAFSERGMIGAYERLYLECVAGDSDGREVPARHGAARETEA